MRTPAPERFMVVPVPLERTIADVALDPGCSGALLAVTLRGAMLGYVLARGNGALDRESQRRAIEAALGDRVRQELAGIAFDRATRDPARVASTPAELTVSVLVRSTGVPAYAVDACVRSVMDSNRRPIETVVVNDAASDPVANLRGDLVAVLDAACRVDPDWLAGIERAFANPLTQAVVGHSAPTGSIDRSAADRLAARAITTATLDGAFALAPLVEIVELEREPVIFRRAFIAQDRAARQTLVCPELGPYVLYSILAAGLRVALDASRLVYTPGSSQMRRSRAFERASRAAACAQLCVLRHRDRTAARAAWTAVRREAQTPIRTATGFAAGLLRGTRAAHRLRGSSTDRTDPSVVEAKLPRSAIQIREGAPRASVVIPTFNRRALVTTALAGLARQTTGPAAFTAIVVVDGSSDGTAEHLESLELPFELRVLSQAHAGRAAACNRGVAESRDPLIIFLDDDIEPEPQFVAVHANAHRDRDRELVAVGNLATKIDCGGSWAQMLRSSWDDHWQAKAEADYQWGVLDFCGGNSSLRRELFHELGGFDPTLLRSEENDFGVRLVEHGARFCFLTRAIGWHQVDPSLAASLATQRHQGRYDVAFVHKHPGLAGRIILAELVDAREGALSKQARAACRVPGLVSKLLPAGAKLAAAADTLQLRRFHQQLAGKLMTAAYLSGVRSAVASTEEMVALVAARGDRSLARIADVDLSREGRLSLASTDASLTLRLMWADQVVGWVQATEAARGWDWARLRERSVAAALPGLRASIPVDEMVTGLWPRTVSSAEGR